MIFIAPERFLLSLVISAHDFVVVHPPHTPKLPLLISSILLTAYYDQFWTLRYKTDILEEVQPKATKMVRCTTYKKLRETSLFRLKAKGKTSCCLQLHRED